MKSRSNPYVLGVTLVIFKESTEKKYCFTQRGLYSFEEANIAKCIIIV